MTLPVSAAVEENSRLLFDFKDESQLKCWKCQDRSRVQWAASGRDGQKNSMELIFDYSEPVGRDARPKGSSYWDGEWHRMVDTSAEIVLTGGGHWPKDFSNYRLLSLDVKNIGEVPCTLIVRMEADFNKTDVLGRIDLKPNQSRTVEMDLRNVLASRFVLNEASPLRLAVLPTTLPATLAVDDIRIANGVNFLAEGIRRRIGSEKARSAGQPLVIDQLSRWETRLSGILADYSKTKELSRVFAELDGLEERVKWFGREDSSLKYALRKQAAGAGKGFELATLTGMTKIMRYAMPKTAKLSEPIRLDLAKGEMEHGQVIVVPIGTDIKNVRWTVNPLTGPGGAKLPVGVRVVGYFRTKGNTTFWFNYPFQKDLIGLWPEPLLDYLDRVDVPYDTVQPLWITVRAGRDLPAGVYTGTLQVAADGFRVKELPIEVKVRSFDIPLTPTFRTATTYLEKETKRLYGKAFTEDLKWKYRKFILAHRLNVDNIYEPFYDLTVEDLKRCKALGQNYITLANYWRPEAAFEKAFIDQINTFYQKVKAAGLGGRDQCSIYSLDEYLPENMGKAKEGCEFLKKNFPNVPLSTSAILPHCGRGTPWEKSFDIWVPHLYYGNSYVGQIAEIPAVRKSGQEVWWYSCCTEAFMIEYPGIEPRMIMGTLTWKYRPDGYVSYCYNHWDTNDHILSDGPECRWNTSWCTNHNGCGIFFYPGKLGPLSSVRFENHTDGMEDYEYFVLLDKVITQAKQLPLTADQKSMLARYEKLLTVPEDIARNMTQYTLDPRPLLSYRAKLANGIEYTQKIVSDFKKGSVK